MYAIGHKRMRERNVQGKIEEYWGAVSKKAEHMSVPRLLVC